MGSTDFFGYMCHGTEQGRMHRLLTAIAEGEPMTAGFEAMKAHRVIEVLSDVPKDAPLIVIGVDGSERDLVGITHANPDGTIHLLSLLPKGETESQPDHDPVNHPSHYTGHPSGVECIEITRHMNFNLGNVVKYVWRAGEKEIAPTVEDLEKARWYLTDEIERRKKEEVSDRKEKGPSD